MANALYDPGREGILDDTIQMSTYDIRVMLVKSTYTFNAAHKFLSDLGAVDNGRSATLGSKTFTSGVFDAGDTSITATSAVACNALVYFYHTGVDATARVLLYEDSPASGLPFTPAAGQSCTVTHDNGANKIFKL